MERLNAEFAVRGKDAGGNKLRTDKKFKENYGLGPSPDLRPFAEKGLGLQD